MYICWWKKSLYWCLAVADTLLWKDKKQTLTAVLILVAIYYNFILSGSTIISTLSQLLLLMLVLLFIHGMLPEKMYVCQLSSLNSNTAKCQCCASSLIRIIIGQNFFILIVNRKLLVLSESYDHLQNQFNFVVNMDFMLFIL